MVQLQPVEDRPVKKIIVHRATVLSDIIITIFKDPSVVNYNIYATVVGMNGREETGESSGVMRDIFTHFWQEVYNAFTTGANERSPIIRHDMQREEWQALAGVILYGFCTLNYFPLRISPVIVSTCLFGEEVFSRQFLLDSFRKYLSNEDQKVFDTC